MNVNALSKRMTINIIKNRHSFIVVCCRCWAEKRSRHFKYHHKGVSSQSIPEELIPGWSSVRMWSSFDCLYKVSSPPLQIVSLVFLKKSMFSLLLDFFVWLIFTLVVINRSILSCGLRFTRKWYIMKFLFLLLLFLTIILWKFHC